MKRKKKQVVTERKIHQSKIATKKEIDLSEPEDGIFTARDEVAVLLKRVGLPQKDIDGVMKKIDKVEKEQISPELMRVYAEGVKELYKLGREIGYTKKDVDRVMKEMDEIEKDKTRQTGPMDAEELQELDEGWMKQDETDKANKVGIWSKDFDKKKRRYIEKAMNEIKAELRRKHGKLCRHK